MGDSLGIADDRSRSQGVSQGVGGGGASQRPGTRQPIVERFGVRICCVIMLVVGLLGGLLLEGATMPEPWSSIADVRPPPLSY
jgi:hypothetical protein